MSQLRKFQKVAIKCSSSSSLEVIESFVLGYFYALPGEPELLQKLFILL